MTKQQEQDFVIEIRKFALEHYDQDGWDVLIECWPDKDILDCIARCRTLKGAIKACSKVLKMYDSYRKDIQATAF